MNFLKYILFLIQNNKISIHKLFVHIKDISKPSTPSVLYYILTKYAEMSSHQEQQQQPKAGTSLNVSI